MSTEVEVISQSQLPDLANNYEQIENASTSAIITISSTIDKLIYEQDEPSDKDINNAIDLADSLCKLLAVTHKGREIEAKRQNQISSVSQIEYTDETDSENV